MEKGVGHEGLGLLKGIAHAQREAIMFDCW